MDRKIIAHFRRRDEILGNLAVRFASVELAPSDDYFRDLVETIICQQLSEKAGATIWNRFVSIFDGRRITPRSVLSTQVARIRSSGTSSSKAAYIHNVSDWFLRYPDRLNTVSSFSDEDVIRELTAIKGIGRWTAEMFLIFSLGREDIFSMGDAGLMKAIRTLYGNGKTMTEKRIRRISDVWIPYRSYASLILWKSLA